MITLSADLDVRALDAASTLTLLQEGVLRRRAAEVDDLELCLRWADLHARDVQDDEVVLGRRAPGGERLVELAGDGAPGVQELAVCELGVARQVHTHSARAVLADVLDLRHRLPQTWALVRALQAEAWVARRVAVLSRSLPYELVGVVDGAVAAAITGQSPGRVLDLAAAKVIEADQAAHEAKVAAQRARRYVGLSRTDETGLRTVMARVTAGEAHWVHATVCRVAEILGQDPAYAETGADELRSVAFGWLARPVQLLTLLLEHRDDAAGAEVPPAYAFPVDLLEGLRSLDLSVLRPRSTLYVHLHDGVLAGHPGVARVEGLGPHRMSALAALLAGTDLSVKPVIDLGDLVCTSSYEFPEAVKERIHLLRPGDQFPHATRTSRAERSVDLDHPVSYEPTGPPSQTRSHTGQPLSRTAHRAKTHLGYSCVPIETGETLWRTPHGLCRVVDGAGTRVIDAEEYDAWTSGTELDRVLARIWHRHRTGQL